MQNLAQKYRPKLLKDIYGQKEVVQYFQSVVRKTDLACRNYVVLGAYGCGKTTLVRAFANELIGTNNCQGHPNYLELDSSEIFSKKDFSILKDLIFQYQNGWRVVVFDEVHLLPREVQGQLLKMIEESEERIFFFFLSTEREGILDTIVSRSLDFNLSTFTHDQVINYLDNILQKENITISNECKEMIALKVNGHLRDAIMQLDLIKISGESFYVSNYVNLMGLWANYFKEMDRVIIDELIKNPVPILRDTLDRFILNELIRRKQIFTDVVFVKFYSTYLKMKKNINTDNDFFCFLYILLDFIKTLRN